LREAFPGKKGFSSRNLEYTKYFAQACPSGLMGSSLLPSWFHLVTLLTTTYTGFQHVVRGAVQQKAGLSGGL
jgi:hypothetical protein